MPNYNEGPLRLPVQYVIRPHQNFRGYAGRIAAGNVAPGNSVKILPSGQAAKIEHVYVGEAELGCAGLASQ